MVNQDGQLLTPNTCCSFKNQEVKTEANPGFKTSDSKTSGEDMIQQKGSFKTELHFFFFLGGEVWGGGGEGLIYSLKFTKVKTP